MIASFRVVCKSYEQPQRSIAELHLFQADANDSRAAAKQVDEIESLLGKSSPTS
jgi:hypothetical protein